MALGLHLPQPDAMNILITDADTRTALAAARSLVGAGYRVYAAAPTRPSLAGAARGVVPVRLAADPLADPSAFARAAADVVKALAIDVLLPVSDETIQEQQPSSSIQDVWFPIKVCHCY